MTDTQIAPTDGHLFPEDDSGRPTSVVSSVPILSIPPGPSAHSVMIEATYSGIELRWKESRMQQWLHGLAIRHRPASCASDGLWRGFACSSSSKQLVGEFVVVEKRSAEETEQARQVGLAGEPLPMSNTR